MEFQNHKFSNFTPTRYIFKILYLYHCQDKFPQKSALHFRTKISPSANYCNSQRNAAASSHPNPPRWCPRQNEPEIFWKKFFMNELLVERHTWQHQNNQRRRHCEELWCLRRLRRKDLKPKNHKISDLWNSKLKKKCVKFRKIVSKTENFTLFTFFDRL